MARILSYAAALAVALALAWALWPRPLAVSVAAIGRGTVVTEITDEGRSRIREIFTVSAPIAGRLERMNLHPGDRVEAGKTEVAQIHAALPPLLDARARRVAEAARDAAAAAVDLARAEVARSESQLAFAQGEAARIAQLYARKSVAERAHDQAQLDLATAEAALSAARANLSERQRQLASAEAVLADAPADLAGTCCTRVLAPASGRVLHVLTESEQVVAAGTPLLEIGDPANIEIVADLLSVDATRIGRGSVARIDGWGGAELPATLVRIEPSAFTKVSALGVEEQRVRTVLRIDGDPALRAGLGDGYRVVVHVLVHRGTDVPVVPLAALFRSDGEWAVFTVRDGRARLAPVELGWMDERNAELLSGIDAGEQVILRPSDQVRDGVRVAPRTE